VKSYPLSDWLRLHNISRAQFYKIQEAGQGPRTFKLMSRIRISEEANNEWLKAREAESVKP
jgi:hypothetical protein